LLLEHDCKGWFALERRCSKGGATRPLPRDGGVEELYGDQQSGHAPRSGPEVKNGRTSAEDGAPERLGWGTVKAEVSQILQRVSAGAA